MMRLAIIVLTALTLCAQQSRVQVVDSTGAEIAGATLQWESATRIRASAPGFADAVVTVLVGGSATIVLDPVRPQTQVTVTAVAGQHEEIMELPELVLSGDGKPGANAVARLEGKPGILLQQTGSGQVSPFLRGLTGYHVLGLVDGVRFNNAIFRSGPNQYLAYIESSQAQYVEAMLGPSGTQYGSDGLGGTIHVFTEPARFDAPGWRGELSAGGQTADWGGALNANLQWGNEKLWLMAGAGARRHSNLRAGHGVDSHNVLTRLFGWTPGEAALLLGDRQLDTAFSGTGTHGKAAWRPTEDRLLTLWYQRGELHGLRNSKDLWGGLGRLQSALEPQVLDLFYARYELFRWAGLDSFSVRISANRQQDGTIRQGLRTADAVTRDWNRVLAMGYAGQALKSWGSHSVFSAGMEIYDERARSGRWTDGRASRPLYPDGSRYRTSGAYGQGATQWRRIRAGYGLRLSHAGYENPVSEAWRTPASRRGVSNVAGQASLLFRLTDKLAIHAAGNRGFRAPNLNDLGAIGLQDLGYEIPAGDAVAAGALLADSAGEGALSKGIRLRTLEPESLRNLEVGMRLTAGGHRVRLQVFDALFEAPIVRRTLLFPAAQPPVSLGGMPVIALPQTSAQRAQGVVTVATPVDSRAVKAFANDGRSRYWGIEADWEARLGNRWTWSSSYSFLAGRDLDPNRNIRRLPPQQGSSSLRYVRSRIWAEAGMFASGAQERLSAGDLDDERIGASRRRQDIVDFFNSARGAAARGQESLASILNRVLPGVGDSVRVPLYRRTPGWAAWSIRAGAPVGEWVTVEVGVANVFDRNYRIHGSGIDAPGRSVELRLRWRF